MSELFSFFAKSFFLCATVLTKYILCIESLQCFFVRGGVVYFFNQCGITLFDITKINQRFFFQKPTSVCLEIYKELALGFYDVEVKINS